MGDKSKGSVVSTRGLVKTTLHRKTKFGTISENKLSFEPSVKLVDTKTPFKGKLFQVREPQI